MNTLIITLLLILICSVGYMIFLLLQKRDDRGSTEKILLLERENIRIKESKIRLESELERKSEELGELR